MEDLRSELARAEAVLNPNLKQKAPENVQLFQLKRVYEMLQHLFSDSSSARAEAQDSSLGSLLEYCWQPGEGGFATSTSETAFMRFAVASWVYHQPWFHSTSQRLFGVGLKEDTEIRCPHCKAKFIRGEMKKQSINRIVIEFRDKFSVRNEHMRNQSAREKFKRLAALKKSRATQTDYQI